MNKPWVPKVYPPKPPWWQIQVVSPLAGATAPPGVYLPHDPGVYWYTVNRSSRGGPELLAFGSDPLLNGTLNSLCVRWDEDGGLPLGEDLLGHSYGPVRLMECPATVHEQYTRQARALAQREGRPEPRVLQVVLADERGRWPWEPGCTRPQPLLGEVKLGEAP
mgnify:FL=1